MRKMNFSSNNNKLFLWLIILLSVNGGVQAQSWQALGPSPLLNGQSEGIPNRPVIGAVHGIAPHPTNANILYLATVNGGVWKTTNATAASPTWTPQTDDKPSMSMGDIEFDPTDATFQTLVAGSGRFSSLGGTGGNRSGVMRTNNGGTTWVQLNAGMDGRNITSVEARGSVMLAAVNFADDNFCGELGLFRSADTGASWNQLSSAQGITPGRATALVSDPNNPAIFYAGIYNVGGACTDPSVDSGIYKSTDTGATWNKVNNAAMDTIISNNFCHFEIAVGNNVGTNAGETSNVFVSMVCSGGNLEGVFRSGNGGTTWTAMSIPETIETSGTFGIHPGGQGFTHSSLTADPTNDNIVYVGGDRQPDGLPGVQFPNSIGAQDYSGRIFRGDASLALSSQWVPLTHSGTASNSAPHADSRELRFDANGSLLESDDGGVYRNNAPRVVTGDWVSVNGDLNINEQHDTSYDSTSSIAFSGNQDNGSSIQNMFAGTTWNNFQGGDGGDVVVDTLTLAGTNQSVRYLSSQNLGGLRRLVFDQNNNFQSTTTLSLTVVNGGAVINPQFVTPLAINQINGNRLIIGAQNSVYESLDQGNTVSEIGVGVQTAGFGRNNIAYGATGNENILYIGGCIGSCSDGSDGVDGIFVRTIAGSGSLNHVFTPSVGTIIQGVVVNPVNPAEAFLIENMRVLHSVDTGANWTDITGALNNFGIMRSIMFLPHASNSGLAIGTNRGVFLSRQLGGYTNWVEPATDFPNVPVFELQYNQANERLIAGTMGRGAFALTGILSGNSAPIAVADVINVTKGGVATTVTGGSISLLNNDSDPDVADTLTMLTTPTSAPFNGVVSLVADGSFSYQHGNSITNSDQFFYRVCDNGIPMFCSDGQVDVIVDLGSIVCSNPNIVIPDDNGATSATDVIFMADAGSISDLNVSVEITHSYVGDIQVSLTHVATGSEVILIDRPGIPIIDNFGCAEDDISVTLDDEALANVEDQCASPIAISGSFSPNNALSGFDGLELQGNWELKVTDGLNQDQGAFISWCIDSTVVAANTAPVLAAIGNQSIAELSTLSFIATATDNDMPAQTLTFSLSGEPSGASINTSGDFSFTPTSAQAPNTYSFDVIVSDGALTDSETITVTVLNEDIYKDGFENP